MNFHKGAYQEFAKVVSSSFIYYESKKDYNEEYICFRIYESYYNKSKETVWSSENDGKIQRFNEISAKRENLLEKDNIFNGCYRLVLLYMPQREHGLDHSYTVQKYSRSHLTNED